MTVQGYGLGGYGGFDEPWGSIEFLIHDLIRNASNIDFMGILEATSNIIGEADNEIGGLYSTKLISIGNVSDTTINVESTLNWIYPGKLSIDGIVYEYLNIIGTTINGITYINEGASVNGLAKIHNIGSEVVNLNNNMNAIQLTRLSLLVDYAEKIYLDAIGKKYGVPRRPLYQNDEIYRAVIKAIAFAPRGTLYGIELALDALLGSSNYEIFEDLIRHPNEVFIKISNDYLLNDNTYGETYISENLYSLISGSFDTIVLPYEPIHVSHIKLKDLGETFDFRNDIPSDVTYEYFEGDGLSSAFTYSGSISEANITENGYYTNFNLGSSGTLYYDMLDTQGARITTTSDVVLDFVISIPSTSVLGSGLLKQISFIIYDGNKELSLGVDNDYSIGFFNTEGGGFIGTTYILTPDIFYNVLIVKNNNKNFSLYINGLLIDKLDYSVLSQSNAFHRFSFGLLGTPSIGCEFNIKQLGINIKNYNDYWSYSGFGIGYVLSPKPPRFNISGGPSFTSSDVGKYLEVINSDVINIYGGNNNIKCKINSIISTNSVIVEPLNYTKGIIGVNGNNNVFKLGDGITKFVYPDDLGKQIEITNSSLGNNGTYTIIDLLVEGIVEETGNKQSFQDYNEANIEYTTTAVLNSELIPEESIDFSILINFINESGLDFIRSSASVISGDTITLISPLWKNGLVMEIGISNALSAQVLQDELVRNTIISTSPLLYKYYPFYLSDIFGELKEFLDDLTIAGVIPRLLGE